REPTAHGQAEGDPRPDRAAAGRASRGRDGGGAALHPGGHPGGGTGPGRPGGHRGRVPSPGSPRVSPRTPRPPPWPPLNWSLVRALEGFPVLVVDGSRAARRVLVAAMASLGSGTCDEAADGAEALKRFAAGEYDLVVTDVHMPRLDGLKLIHHIRSGSRGA